MYRLSNSFCLLSMILWFQPLCSVVQMILCASVMDFHSLYSKNAFHILPQTILITTKETKISKALHWFAFWQPLTYSVFSTLLNNHWVYWVLVALNVRIDSSNEYIYGISILYSFFVCSRWIYIHWNPNVWIFELNEQKNSVISSFCLISIDIESV